MDLATVIPKGQSPPVKVRECNIPVSEIDNNCNSILRPADNNGVNMKLKKSRIKLGMYFWANYTMFPLYWTAIVLFQFLCQISLLFPLDYALISMITLSDSSGNASFLKIKRSVPFQKYTILYFFDLKAHSLASKLIKISCSVLNGNRNRSRPAQNEMLFPLQWLVLERSEKRSSKMET